LPSPLNLRGKYSTNFGIAAIIFGIICNGGLFSLKEGKLYEGKGTDFRAEAMDLEDWE
jgi:hypothetical protein